MRLKILSLLGMLLSLSSVILSYYSPEQRFTLKITVVLERKDPNRIAIDVTHELLNGFVPSGDCSQGVMNKSYGERLVLELRGLSLPYYTQLTSPPLIIQSDHKLILFIHDVEPGEYSSEIRVYQDFPLEQAEPILIGEDIRTLQI